MPQNYKINLKKNVNLAIDEEQTYGKTVIFIIFYNIIHYFLLLVSVKC